MLLEVCLGNWLFSIQVDKENSDWNPIGAGVSQESVLDPTLYLLYTADIYVSENTMIAFFADDTVLVTYNDNYESAIASLHSTVHHIASWEKYWKNLPEWE